MLSLAVRDVRGELALRIVGKLKTDLNAGGAEGSIDQDQSQKQYVQYKEIHGSTAMDIRR